MPNAERNFATGYESPKPVEPPTGRDFTARVIAAVEALNNNSQSATTIEIVDRVLPQNVDEILHFEAYVSEALAILTKQGVLDFDPESLTYKRLSNQKTFRDLESSQPDTLRSKIIDALLKKIQFQINSYAGEEKRSEDPKSVSLSYLIEAIVPNAPHGTLEKILALFHQPDDQTAKAGSLNAQDRDQEADRYPNDSRVEALLEALVHLGKEGIIQIDLDSQCIVLPKLRQTHS